MAMLGAGRLLLARPVGTKVWRTAPRISPTYFTPALLCRSTNPRQRFFSSLSARRKDKDRIETYSYDPRYDRNSQYHQSRLAEAKPLAPWITDPNHQTSSRFRPRWFPSRTQTIYIAVAAACIFYFLNLQTVPVSGRRRFNCFSDGVVRWFTAAQAEAIIMDLKRQGVGILPAGDRRVRLVERVMSRLIPVSGGTDGEQKQRAWRVHVIDAPGTANAMVLPSGDVFVFSGLFGLCSNESQLAVPLGHEIAHNLAQHVGERLSSNIGPNILLGAMSVLSLAFPPTLIANYLIGSWALDVLFNLPMTRMQESEADYIGLMMMAEACYDPKEAITFWKRMDIATRTAGGGGREEVPEFLSTHPSHEARGEKMREWMAAAEEKRRESDCSGTQGFAERFRRAMARGEYYEARVS